MNDILLIAAGLIVFAVALGLASVLRGADDIDGLMAAQLLGSGGIGTLLLIASATSVPGVGDVALGLALLAPFATIAFINVLESDDAEAGP